MINRNKYLKEFLIANPPQFKINPLCCHYAKKAPSARYLKTHKCDLACTGVRQAEGGVRSTAYTDCFSYDEHKKIDTFRPLFFFREEDKKTYCDWYGITHSRCYTEYGFKRTGCVGCPFNLRFEEDLTAMQKFEPNTYKLAVAMFGKSYDYTRQYRAFQKEMREREAATSDEISLSDELPEDDSYRWEE